MSCELIVMSRDQGGRLVSGWKERPTLEPMAVSEIDEERDLA
jgi:hypothetical protein